jgi:hypothetical protein
LGIEPWMIGEGKDLVDEAFDKGAALCVESIPARSVYRDMDGNRCLEYRRLDVQCGGPMADDEP